MNVSFVSWEHENIARHLSYPFPSCFKTFDVGPAEFLEIPIFRKQGFDTEFSTSLHDPGIEYENAGHTRLSYGFEQQWRIIRAGSKILRWVITRTNSLRQNTGIPLGAGDPIAETMRFDTRATAR